MAKMERSEEAQAYIEMSVMPRIRAYSRRVEATGCDVWIGSKTKGGYPDLSTRRDLLGKAVIHVHRWLLEEAHGPLAPGMDAEHACRNRACIRIHPEHVRALPHLENVRIGEAHTPEANARRSAALRS